MRPVPLSKKRAAQRASGTSNIPEGHTLYKHITAPGSGYSPLRESGQCVIGGIGNEAIWCRGGNAASESKDCYVVVPSFRFATGQVGKAGRETELELECRMSLAQQLQVMEQQVAQELAMQQQVEALLTQQQQQYQMQIAQLQASQPLTASRPMKQASKSLAVSSPIKAKLVSSVGSGTSAAIPLLVLVVALFAAWKRR